MVLHVACLLSVALFDCIHGQDVLAAVRAQNVESSGPIFNKCGESIDPNSLPFPNMAAAMNGYDLPKGDPFSSTLVDPGWRHQIFEHTRRDDVGCYVPNYGITSIDLNSCSGKFSSHVLRTFKDHREQKLKSFSSGYNLQWGTDVDVDVKAKGVSVGATIPPMITRGSSEGETDAKTARFFKDEKGVMVFREALCLTHRLFIDDYDIPGFTRGFNLSVQALYNAPSHRRRAEFKRFVTTYGTHYSSETQMGAKFSHFQRYSGVDQLNQDSSAFKKCSDIKGTKIFWFQVEKDKAECKQFSEQNSQFRSAAVDEVFWTTYGSRPAGSLIEWAQQSLDSPVPIRMKFQPIPNLFTDELMPRFGADLNAAEFRKWLIPLYLDYCNIFEVDCGPKEGCGLSDNCNWGDTCSPDPNALGGHRCSSYKLGNFGENCDAACNRDGRPCNFVSLNTLQDTKIRQLLLKFEPRARCTSNHKAPTSFDHPLLKGQNADCHGWGTRDSSTTKLKCSYLNPNTGGNHRRLCECDQDTCNSFACHHGGKCIETLGRYRCECTFGFHGDHCQSSNFVLGNFSENCNAACRRLKNKDCKFGTLNTMEEDNIKSILLSLDKNAKCTNNNLKDPKWLDHPLLYGSRAECQGWGKRKPDTVKLRCSYLNRLSGSSYRRLCECP